MDPPTEIELTVRIVTAIGNMVGVSGAELQVEVDSAAVSMNSFSPMSRIASLEA